MKHARKYNCGSFFIFMLPSPKFLWKVIKLLSMIVKWKRIILLSTWKGLKVFKYAFILPHLNLKKIDVLFSFIMPAFHNWFYWRLLNFFHDSFGGRILNINLAQLKVLIFAIIHPQFHKVFTFNNNSDFWTCL